MQCFPSGQGKGGQIRSHWNFEVKQESCRMIQNNIHRIGDSPKTPKVPLKQTPLILCNKPTLQEESKYHQNQHGSILYLKKKKGFQSLWFLLMPCIFTIAPKQRSKFFVLNSQKINRFDKYSISCLYMYIFAWFKFVANPTLKLDCETMKLPELDFVKF